MKKNGILVSFIIPVYNAEPYLDRCLGSITALKSPEVEVILVDDGSVDKSLLICERYARLDVRIKVLKKKKGGASSARNMGMDAANGEWISFIDSDDEIVPDIYDNLILQLDERAELWMIGCKIQCKDRSENRGEKMKRGTWKGTDVELIKRALFNEDIQFGKQIEKEGFNFKGPCAKFYKRSIIIEKNLRFPEGIAIAEDRIFNFGYLNSVKKIFYTSEYGYYYWMNVSSITHSYEAGKGKQFLGSLSVVYQLLLPEWQIDFSQYGVWQYLRALKMDWCNPKNPDSYYKRRKEALHNRNNYYVREAFQAAGLFGFRWEAVLLVLCAKWKCFFMCNFLLKIKTKLHIKFQ